MAARHELRKHHCQELRHSKVPQILQTSKQPQNPLPFRASWQNQQKLHLQQVLGGLLETKYGPGKRDQRHLNQWNHVFLTKLTQKGHLRNKHSPHCPAFLASSSGKGRYLSMGSSKQQRPRCETRGGHGIFHREKSREFASSCELALLIA